MNIFVSGAGSGIGAAMAKIFAQDAGKLVLHAKGDAGLAGVASEISELYPKLSLHCLYADLAEESARAELLVNLQNLFADGVDILVNNAGVFLPCDCEYADLSAVLEYSWQVNMLALLEITHKLLPYMRSRGGGHIFNLCSTASLRAYPKGMAYGISKYALKGFSDNLRAELREYKIKVTAILPGATWTKSWVGMEAFKAQMMHAEDVAKMAYMASKLSPQAVVEEIIMRPLIGDLQL